MKPFTITMALSKETKGTFVYEQEADEAGQPPKITTLYVQKWALGKTAPATIEVTVVPK